MTQINEALAAYHRWADDEDVPDLELVERIILAYEKAKRDWITCSSCEAWREVHAVKPGERFPCPDCVDGMIPSITDEMVSAFIDVWTTEGELPRRVNVRDYINDTTVVKDRAGALLDLRDADEAAEQWNRGFIRSALEAAWAASRQEGET